jgi:hypothetical protein
MYGAPEFKTDKLLDTVAKGAKSIGESILEATGQSIDYKVGMPVKEEIDYFSYPLL